MITQEQRNNIIEWIAALRSGEYIQRKGLLQHEDGSCCGLGVACNVLNLVKKKKESYFSFSFNGISDGYVMPLIFFKNKFGDFLDRSVIIDLNDQGRSFDEIANYIEKQLEEYETL